MGIATELLRTSWEESADRLTRRCEGLTDDEYRWTPTADAWTVRPDPDRPGRWTYDYDFARHHRRRRSLRSAGGWCTSAPTTRSTGSTPSAPDNGRAPIWPCPAPPPKPYWSGTTVAAPSPTGCGLRPMPISPNPAPATWVTRGPLVRSFES